MAEWEEYDFIKDTNSNNYPLHKGNINRLVSLTQEESYPMPSGLTREERKQWVISLLHQNLTEQLVKIEEDI